MSASVLVPVSVSVNTELMCPNPIVFRRTCVQLLFSIRIFTPAVSPETDPEDLCKTYTHLPVCVHLSLCVCVCVFM